MNNLKMELIKAEVTLEGVLSGTHALELFAEVERLTALCDEYRGERDALKAENGRLREELGEEEHDISLTDKLAMSESVAEQWMSRAEIAESALTRARAEGMEEAMMLTRDWADCTRPGDEARTVLVALAQNMERKIKCAAKGEQ